MDDLEEFLQAHYDFDRGPRRSIRSRDLTLALTHVLAVFDGASDGDVYWSGSPHDGSACFIAQSGSRFASFAAPHIDGLDVRLTAPACRDLLGVLPAGEWCAIAREGSALVVGDMRVEVVDASAPSVDVPFLGVVCTVLRGGERGRAGVLQWSPGNVACPLRLVLEGGNGDSAGPTELPATAFGEWPSEPFAYRFAAGDLKVALRGGASAELLLREGDDGVGAHLVNLRELRVVGLPGREAVRCLKTTAIRGERCAPLAVKGVPPWASLDEADLENVTSVPTV